MAQISLDNGYSFMDAAETIEYLERNTEDFGEYSTESLLYEIYSRMDDDIREELHFQLAPCTDLEFLTAYCEKASEDIVVG